MANIKSLEQEIAQCTRQVAEHRKEYDKLKSDRVKTLVTGNVIGAVGDRHDAIHHEDEANRLERRIQELRHELESMRQHVRAIDDEIHRTKQDSEQKIRYLQDQSKKHIAELEQQKHYYLG